MMLLDEDVNRIVELGYEEKFFVRIVEGFKILQNSSEGRCVFHDGQKCTIYPIIFDEDQNRAVKDNHCPHKSEFKISGRSKMDLSSVYRNLMSERHERNGSD
jgi:hypothetical protein